MTVTPSCRTSRALAALAMLLALAAPASAQALDADAQLAFLHRAKVVASRPIGKGITGALRVTLSDGALTHDAAFQSVAKELVGSKVPRNLRQSGEVRFVDHYRYNIAAWRLSGLLGIAHMMPPTVERRIGGAFGALSWWMDDVLMDEQEREAKGAQPPGDALGFARQRQTMWVFAELVRDIDRNKGNVVYTKDWRLIMLDFSRAFRLQKELKEAVALNGCSRDLLSRLRALSEPALKDAVEQHLTGAEVAAVMARRDLLVAHFERLIAQRGEAGVLY